MIVIILTIIFIFSCRNNENQNHETNQSTKKNAEVTTSDKKEISTVEVEETSSVSETTEEQTTAETEDISSTTDTGNGNIENESVENTLNVTDTTTPPTSSSTPVDNGEAGNTEETTESRKRIPAGCTFYDASEDILLVEGDYFPLENGYEDVYTTSEYKYKYSMLLDELTWNVLL